MAISIVILAAGLGARMRSNTPKVLHKIAGKTLIEHVIQTAATLPDATAPIIIYGHQGDLLKKSLAHYQISWAHQTQQLGTGHAVLQALPHISKDNQVLILSGDVPLISNSTLQKFLQNTTKNTLGILTATVPNPTGLGRIIRDQKNQIIKITEEKDLIGDQAKIQEINTGIYLVAAEHLQKWLPLLKNNNAQQEFYLTDIIEIALNENIKIIDTQAEYYQETLGINNRQQLATLERFYQKQQAEKFLTNGVTLIDPDRFDVRGDISIEKDSIIDINVILEGQTKIGERCSIGPHCILRNTIIGNDVEIRAHSIIDGAIIADNCTVGPFARIRPDTRLAEQSHVGNFVEIKNSVIGFASKVNHLTYIGDSQIGEKTNIGAGTITCNYDGAQKHKTIIGDHVFIGSNSALVAPVTINSGATIAAGSTITRDAPANQLTIARVKQKSIENWQRPIKTTKES